MKTNLGNLQTFKMSSFHKRKVSAPSSVMLAAFCGDTLPCPTSGRSHLVKEDCRTGRAKGNGGLERKLNSLMIMEGT